MSALTVGSLFSGIGGLDLAVESFFDAQTAWHCEWDDEPSKVLASRWPGVPNYRDVRTVNWDTVEPVDIMCGGFPCQDVSLAGRRAGMKEGTRSGLWSEFARAIDIVRPSVVVIENVRGLLSADAGSNVEPCPWCMGDGADEYHLRALDAVLADLSDLGFDAEWTGLRAADVGAPHGRFRFFLLAYARDFRYERPWPARDRGTRPADGDSRGDRDLALFPTPMVGSSNPAAHGQISGDFRKRMDEALAHVALLPTPQVADASGGHASRSGDRSDELLLPGIARERAASVDWGQYEAAVRIWESITRPAPAPTLPDGKNGNHRLAAVFPEWMMGYPAGWVTDILNRNPAIKACGNGVVPQQAFAALTILWARVLAFLAVAA
ncbi:DNA cytosine methyltransferase [Microbacterium telephonicum]|uniref:DNA (cytosine-5-)-methyltransferase n=1 Tax=Microbacterium telephonicum TaxID=1714841 RepID=A0A498BW77_9MICO|nr:DNA cytosine methyltransferase [Microbacterium telephonicum]RLK47642.1 DNA (cytosine-5)-methyltransferase 1 [Microbacterium telephonicum]